MSPITPRRFQEIEELSRELFPEEEGGQHQLSEDRRLAIRDLLQERAELRNRVQELFRQLPNLVAPLPPEYNTPNAVVPTSSLERLIWQVKDSSASWTAGRTPQRE